MAPHSNEMEDEMLTYSLQLSPNYDGMVMVTFPDVPEAVALGRDHDEALEQALAALESALEGYVAEGRPFPLARANGGIKVTSVRFSELTPA
jgi:antitoxin HicB